MGVGEIAELLLAGIEQAGRDLVQPRLPDMRRGAVDQRDLSPVGAAADGSAEARRELQAAGTAADDHDAR